ncbi:hypothetical protein LJR231_002772 [Phyllobacterium sp. LjRoot231]|uniref:hypothetical protein n=1 Tax=Phyllobacterium sp. LjRoot231 TaxID=3342289 RepID=UPI003ECC39F6
MTNRTHYYNTLDKDTNFGKNGTIVGSSSLLEIAEYDRNTSPDSRPSILIWRGALLNDAIREWLISSSWPLSCFNSFSTDKRWEWTVTNDQQIESVDKADIIRQITSASPSADNAAQGNIIATLKIRDYEQRDDYVGGSSWWRECLDKKQNIDLGFGHDLAMMLMQQLENASRVANTTLVVEQISMVLAKDPTKPLATLTPTLHSDSYYGARESAICSLTERGFNRFGGAVFLPSYNMDELWHQRPIDMEKLQFLFKDTEMFHPSSGDVAIYDGMINGAGIQDRSLGVPHISPDIPGLSSRLVVLMRRIP